MYGIINYFDKCYTKLSLYDKSKITMYGVNENYEKKYNKKKDYQILFEYDLPIYDKSIQTRNYCQTSALIHIYKNKLYKKYNYIGFMQYDMEIYEHFVNDIETHFKKINNLIKKLFFIVTTKKELLFHFICSKTWQRKSLRSRWHYFTL